jgi:Tfp pilus assembly protein PilV
MKFHRKKQSPAATSSAAGAAFTLLEVMIACGIFFMATFAILALVSGTLRNARSLQSGDIDAAMAAAQVYELLRTNRMESGSLNGDFGETHRDFSWNADWDVDYDGGATNSLLKVNVTVSRRGARNPVDQMSIWVYSPYARGAMGAGGPRPR